MTRYLCKCGRELQKSTKAETTGNRDTADCTGCPYLLPYGPMRWDGEQNEYRQDVQGHECRMSQRLEYASGYIGNAASKTVLSVLSLDFDFLERISDWIRETYPGGELSGSFSCDAIRTAEYGGDGRYRMAIYCAQNRKGLSAKAALLEHFFDNHGQRRDLKPEEEKTHVLAAIEVGKMREQRKDTAMKKMNDRCPLQQECERTCKVIGHERDCDYYVNNRYCTGGIPDQDEILMEEEMRREREWEEERLAAMSMEEAEPIAYCNEYGTIFAVRKHKGIPDLMCKAKDADKWTLSGVLVAVKGDACTAADLQEVLDEYAQAHGWQKFELDEQSKADDCPCESCRCPDCEDKDCPQAGCDRSDMGLGCMAPDEDCPNDKEKDGCKEKEIAPSGDAAATTTENAVINAAETATGPMDASSSSAPVSPADAGVATQSLYAADPASLEVQHLGSLAYDFGAGDEINAVLLQDAQIFMAGSMTRIMAAKHAHDRTANYYRGSWGKWCEFVGISRDTGDNMVRVAEQFGNIQIDGQNLIDLQPMKLLYIASKSTTPPEIRKRVETLDITTCKQYQEALAEIRARDTKIEDLLEMSEAADRRAEEAERKRKEANEGYSAAMETLRQAQEDAANADARARAAEIKARELETRPVMSELFDAKQRIRELESRPIEVAVKEPDPEVVEAKARELAAQRTAMLEAQVRSLQEDKDLALRRLDEVGNTAYLAAAEFADRAAETIDSIRTAFWALAAELSEADFFDALAPLDEAARKIRDREWEEDEANV